MTFLNKIIKREIPETQTWEAGKIDFFWRGGCMTFTLITKVDDDHYSSYLLSVLNYKIPILILKLWGRFLFLFWGGDI